MIGIVLVISLQYYSINTIKSSTTFIFSPFQQQELQADIDCKSKTNNSKELITSKDLAKNALSLLNVHRTFVNNIEFRCGLAK